MTVKCFKNVSTVELPDLNIVVEDKIMQWVTWEIYSNWKEDTFNAYVQSHIVVPVGNKTKLNELKIKFKINALRQHPDYTLTETL